MSITITGPKALTLPAAMGGDDQLYGLTLVCVSRGLIVHELGNGVSQIRGVKDTDLVTTDVVSLLVSKGCEVDGYHVYFEIDDVTALCPFSEETATTDPETGEETIIPQETWETWGVVGESHKPTEIDGKWYRSSCDAKNRGEPLPASKWVPLVAAGTLTVITIAQWQALQPEPEGV